MKIRETAAIGGAHERPPLTLDYEQSRRFLKVLNPENKGLTFQTFDDQKERKNLALARVIQSPPPARNELSDLNEQGAGIFVTVNDTDGKGRKSKNITRVRSVWQEDDDDFDGAFPLDPSMVVQTSPGHFHRYWRVADDWPADERGRADFAAVMERMVESYGSDKNAKDIARVLRFPGFLHRKGTTPHLVRIVEVSERRYSRAEIIAAFPPVEQPKKDKTQHREWIPLDSDEGRIANALKHINADDRDLWVQCGMAIKDHLGDGRQLWDGWSRQSDKYNERDQDRTWKSFKRNGISIGTLFYHAQQAGWRDERINHRPPNGAGRDRADCKHASNGSNDGGTKEPPRPLIRELPPADPFPIDALGDLLGSAAKAIHERIRCPVAICGQSVIAAATLAAQAHADVELPTGHVKPISNDFVTVAETGERKTAADNEALWPVRKREEALREEFDVEALIYENQKIAWKEAQDHAVKKAKGNREAIESALDAIGPPPTPPLMSMLTCPEPTYEGLCKYLQLGQPSIGVFASEGGSFIGGHGMSDESKLRTAAGLSTVWDGEPIKRVRASDGTVVLPGRRVAIHLMAQPDVAAIMLSDQMLLSQGLLSRCLITAPESISGTRVWREPSASVDAAMKRYGERLLQLLERPLPLKDGKKNELVPRVLRLSANARRLCIAFMDSIELQIAPEGPLCTVKGIANKLPEHAARLAGVLALVSDADTSEIPAEQMAAGIILAQHYVTEALRLFEASRVSDNLRLAQRLLQWLLVSWSEDFVSLPDIYQTGPNAIRDKTTAARLVAILEDHGWLIRERSGAKVAGQHRRDAWRIMRRG
jgi:Protein of unknown function (DUF3987)/Primase C terminal 2 (PriCT-2)/RepB DNA-primase from phage plasmid